MTIPASMPARASYTGDGVTVNFPIPFIYFANPDGTKQVKVVLAGADGENETVLKENTDFTITAAGSVNGTLTMFTAPATGKKLTIIYDIPIEQLTDYKEFGRLPSESIEAALDKVTAILKQMQEVLNRCVKDGVTGAIDVDTTIAHIHRVYASVDNIDTVSGSISSVKTVAGNISKVNTVSGSIGNVNKVSASIDNVNKTGNAIGNVNTVAGSIGNVNNVGNSINNVNKVGNAIGNVNTVSGNIGSVNKVAGNIGNVNAAGSASGAITAINGKISVIETLANKLYVLLRVYDNISDVINTSVNMADIVKLSALFEDNTSLLFGGFADTPANDYGEVYHGGTATAAASEYGETVSGGNAGQVYYTSIYDVFKICADNLITFEQAPLYAAQAANSAQSANAALESINATLAVIHGGTAANF